MKSDMEYIVQELGSVVEVSQINSPDFARIDALSSITEASSFSRHTLYVAAIEMSLPDDPECINVMCIGFSPVLAGQDRRNIIVVASGVPGYMIDFAVSSVRNRRLNFSETSQKLFEILYNGGGLQAIIDIGTKMLSAPLNIMDTSFKMLAFHESLKNSSALTQETIRNGYLGPQSLKRYNERRRHASIIKSLHPILTPNDGESQNPPKYGWLDIAVRIRGNVVAYMCASGLYHPFSAFDIDCFSFLAKLAAMELQKDPTFARETGFADEALLRDILNRQLSDDALISQRFRTLGLALEPVLYVAVVQPLSGTAYSPLPSGTKSALCGFFRKCLSANYDNRVVLLIMNENITASIYNSYDSYEVLCDFLRTGKLQMGLSNPFTCSSQIEHHYQQAINAVRLGNKSAGGSFVFRYADYSFFHCLESSGSGGFHLADLCHPTILELYQKKDSSSRELFSTLKCYLIYAKNTTKISETLHIHRSTLFYRINKFQSLYNIDLDDENIVSQFIISFAVLEYIDAARFTAGLD